MFPNKLSKLILQEKEKKKTSPLRLDAVFSEVVHAVEFKLYFKHKFQASIPILLGLNCRNS